MKTLTILFKDNLISSWKKAEMVSIMKECERTINVSRVRLLAFFALR